MLKEYYPYEYAPGVFAIDYKKLWALGIRGIIFDVDNTLVHHGDDSNPKIDRFFEKLHKMGFKTLMLSDNEKSRVERFNKNIGTLYICDADKPSPQGYLKALELMGLEKKQTVCIGDQIITDIRGANNAGIPSILVRFIRLPQEKRIGKRRYIEYFVMWTWKHSKKYRHRFGNILRSGK